MKSQKILTDFSGGELSPRIFTRGYSDVYQTGLKECTNFTILRQGGAFRCPGFEHVLAAFASTATRGIAFSMAHEDDIDIDLEFGNTYCRIVKDGAVINSGSNLTTPWTAAQLPDVQYAQDGDVMYLVHPAHAPRTITRTTDASWAIATISFTDVPQVAFSDGDSPTPADGTLTLTEGGTWVPGDSFEMYMSGILVGPVAWSSSFATLINNVRAAINAAFTPLSYAIGSPPSFSIVDNDPQMDITFTGAWAFVTLDGVTVYSAAGTMTEGGAAGTASSEDAWSATRGWPRTVALHEQRLLLGGTDSLPNYVWGSQTGLPTIFTLGVNDGDAFQFQMQGGRHGVAIQWMESKRVLAIGTSSGDYVQNAVPLTPTNVNFVRMTSRRSAYMQPVEVDSELFYAQRGKKALRSFAFEESSQNWQTADANFLADHMPNTAMKQLGYAELPDSVVYAVTNDNYLICLTYDRANQVGAWWRRVCAADILSAWTVHNPTTAQDEIHAIVSYGGSRYLWNMRATSERVLTDAKSGAGIVRSQKTGAFGGYLDGFVVATGSDITSVSSLPWADGTVLQVVGDDALQADATVASGAVTGLTAADTLVVGLGYTSKMITLPLEGGNPGGTSQAKKRRWVNPHLRVIDSFPPKVNGAQLPDRPVNSLMDTAAPLVNGDLRALVTGHGEGAQLTITAEAGLPCQITGIFGDIDVGGG